MMKNLLTATVIFASVISPVYANINDISIKKNPSELNCLAVNLYHEARGEDPIGIIAVGAVVLNRVHSKNFPNTVCGVVKQGGERRNKCQFSWWCDGRSDKIRDPKAWKKMVKYAKVILSHRFSDPTNGSLFYHSVKVKPYWAKSKTAVVTFGNHVFYR